MPHRGGLMITRRIIFIFLVMFFSTNILFAAQMESKATDQTFVQNLVFVDEDIAFRIAGPKDWYGAMQSVKQDGKLASPSWPPERRALYIKYFKNSQPDRIITPMFTVSSTLKGDSTSSMNALETFIADLPPEILLAQPSMQKLGNSEWAVCELTVPVEANNQTLRVIRKIFMLMHKENFIVVEGTSSSEEYQNDKELFDQAVSAISSTDDLTALWMETDENASDGTPKMVNVVMDGFFTQNLVYGNEPLAFRLAGPKDWYGAMQYVKEDGKLAFPLWPPALGAAYIKYYKEI